MAGLTRKEFLKLELAGGAALALPFGTSACSSGDQTGALLRSPVRLPEPFSVPRPVQVLVYGFATLGVLFSALIVAGVLADCRNFDRTTGGLRRTRVRTATLIK